jgi:hypothetical protein
MAHNVTVILDDRTPPPPEVVAAIGNVPFARILRRRRRLADEIREAAETGGGAFRLIETDEAAEALAARIEDRGPGPLYLRLPACIAPLRMSALAMVVEKTGYALETMFLSPIRGDEAPALLTAQDAAAVLRAHGAEARRAVLLRLAEAAPKMVDHLEMVDLRRTRQLLRFLTGSTEARHFNDTEAAAGVFHKSSTDIAKMRAEHGFFHVAPEAMKRFLIPTFNFWEKGARAGYAMEHMPVPDAALQLVHGAFAPEDFDLLLDQFFAFLDSRGHGPADRAATLAAGRAHVLGKLDARLDALMAMETGRRLDAVLTASGPRGGLRAMQAAARPLIDAALVRYGAERLVTGHGDPCFSNILFDRRLGLMRLIDPRGATRTEEALMHPLYDLAKFSHSALGGYDFINNDLFACQLDGDLLLSLRLDGDGPPAWARAALRARLAVHGVDVRAVRAVELSLFLSMLPLHADHPRKLAGFALTAASILEELEAEA